MCAAVSSCSVLIAVCASQFVLPFMLAGVNAVLPILGADLALSAREISLISTVYTLSLAVAQLSSGRLGDIWGRRRLFLAGLGLFALCSAALAEVRQFEMFLALRFLQGIGAALFNAGGLAILMTLTPPHQRGAVLGVSAAAVYAGVSCGPALAGVITGTFGWPALFRATALAAACAWLLMRHNLREVWRPNRGEPFDRAGCLSYGAFMLLLTAGASSLQDASWAPWALTGALCLFVLYVRLEWHAPYPLLELRLFTRNRVFTLSALASFVNYAAGIGLGFYFSVYLQTLRGLSVNEAGFFLAGQAIVQMFTAPFAGRLADRHGPGRISTLGIFLCGAGIASASFIDMRTPLILLVGIQLILGLGFGLFATPNTAIILESAGSRYLGQAAGLTGAVRTGGMLVSMIIVTLSLSIFVGHDPVSPANAPAFMESMRLDFLLFSGLNLFALVCSLGRMSYDRERASEKMPPGDGTV